jgi:putative ABC transport system ATP-binding protein
MFQGSMRDNLFYTLKHGPVREMAYEGSEAKDRQWEIKEAQAAGNPSLDFHSDWIDYHSLGIKGSDELRSAAVEVLDTVALSQDVFELGLRSMSPTKNSKLSSQIQKVRAGLRKRLEAEGLTESVVPFEPDSYSTEATVAENLIFGAPTRPAEAETSLNAKPLAVQKLKTNPLAAEKLKTNPYVRTVLKTTGLDQDLYHLGLEIAANVVEILGDLTPDHAFFQQLSFMTAEEIPDYRGLLQIVKDKPFSAVAPADASRILALSFGYSEPRYRFGILETELMKRLVEGRKVFHRDLPKTLKDSIETYDPERYNSAASILDNALFGRIAHRQADVAEKISSIVREVLEELGLYGDVIDAGLNFNVGAGGRRLTVAQRQKLNLARTLLKRADFLILNKPLSAVDVRTQERVLRAVLEMTSTDKWSPAVLWVLSTPTLAPFFQRVIVFERGRPVEDGDF